MKKRTIWIIWVGAMVLAAGMETTVAAAEKSFQVDPERVLDTLVKGHPRLMLKEERLRELKSQAAGDPALRKVVAEVIGSADGYLKRGELRYRKVGPRLLHVSRDCMQRVYTLGLAWRWTGEEKYARKAKGHLLTVCGFKDWNPSHFLDTAEMSHAVGVGYDWLYGYLDAESREVIRRGLIRNGLEEGVKAYQKMWWRKSQHNWNQVCNGGLIAGALALAESDPKYAQTIIPAAVQSLPLALASYGPDGAWMEGPGYWHYASRYTAYGFTALETALGTDFGLLGIEGVSKAGLFPIYCEGPTGMYLNFADCGGKSARRPMSCMFWLSRAFKNPLYSESEHAQLARRGAGPGHLVWYVPRSTMKIPPLSRDYYFRGDVEIALFRSGWGDPEALWAGVKGGYNQVNHGHLDLGNFELEALGVRWAIDLGSDDYNMPGYWDRKQGGRRWTYYRLNSLSHNVGLLGNTIQHAKGKAKFVKCETNVSRPGVVIDLTSAYQDFAKKVTRGVALVQERRAVLVQDEYELSKRCEVAWGMTTEAEISSDKPNTAILTQKGKSLTAWILSPAGAAFTVESAEQKPPQKSNRGIRRLMVRLPEREGSVRLAVLLAPNWGDGQAVTTTSVKALADW